MPEYTHNGLGIDLVLKDHITQGDLEAYAAAYREINHVGEIEHRGAMVRAWQECGLIFSPDLGDVGQQDARWVKWISDTIQAYYTELTEIPPE